MAEIQDLLEGYKKFYQKYFVKEDIYKNLATIQAPKSLVICCSDSRVDPAILLNCKPGEIFVVRNIGNLVPPYTPANDELHGVSAAIEYAITHLKVKNIIIIGHSNCGGIKALLALDSNSPKNFINNWVNIARNAKENNDLEKTCNNSINISINNLKTFPIIKEKLENKELEIHGWKFSLETGKLDIIEK